MTGTDPEPRILVVDDEPDVVEFVVDILQANGHRATGATDSGVASGLLNGAPFDVVISDIVMPGLNGLELLSLARARNAEVQVVLITAHASDEMALAALDRGAAGFLEKPVDPQRLLQTVNEALWRARLRRRSREPSA